MQNLLQHCCQVLLAGRWVEGDKITDVRNPFDGSIVESVAVPSKESVESVVRSAAEAFETTRHLPLHVRAAALSHLASCLDRDREEIARLITQEGGKPIKWSRGEISRSISTFTWAAEECKREGGELHRLDTDPAMGSRLAMVRRFPIGPNLGISAFNFPLLLAAHKVAPAIATGSPIILKPSPQAPLTANVLVGYLLETDFPSEAFSALVLDAKRTQELVTDPRLPVISFTGSATVGWMLKGLAPKKKVSLELGGNAAVIIDEDADVELAAERIAFGAYYHGGQSCISVQRVLVHEDRKEELLASLSKRIAELRTGDPMDEATDIGPLISSSALDRVSGWVQEAEEMGAVIVAGGERRDPFFAPTLLVNAKSEMRAWREEIFGPVAAVATFTDLAEALRQVNESRYGLQAGLFSQRIHVIMDAYRSIEAGGVIINDVPSFRADHMPYGGVKDSGFGREGIRFSMDEISEPKVMILSHIAL